MAEEERLIAEEIEATHHQPKKEKKIELKMMEKTTIADGKSMEKKMIDDGKSTEKMTIADGKTIKLVAKEIIDEKIKRFWTKYESGCIVWHAKKQLKRFPEGFISKFLENFNKCKAGMEKKHVRVRKPEVDLAVAAAIAANQKIAANKPSKKNKKTNKTHAKKTPTDFESMKERLLSSKSKERELLLAQRVMYRTGKLFSFAQQLDYFWPELFITEEELQMAEEARLEDEKRAKQEKERKMAIRLAMKERRQEEKLDRTIAILVNSTPNCGFPPPPTEEQH